MKQSKPLLLVAGLLLCMTPNARPSLADAAVVPQPVAYSQSDTNALLSGAVARTKNLRLACYPVWGQCTRDSDCCTGFCRVGRVTAYCDYK